MEISNKYKTAYVKNNTYYEVESSGVTGYNEVPQEIPSAIGLPGFRLRAISSASPSPLHLHPLCISNPSASPSLLHVHLLCISIPSASPSPLHLHLFYISIFSASLSHQHLHPHSHLHLNPHSPLLLHLYLLCISIPISSASPSHCISIPISSASLSPLHIHILCISISSASPSPLQLHLHCISSSTSSSHLHLHLHLCEPLPSTTLYLWCTLREYIYDPNDAYGESLGCPATGGIFQGGTVNLAAGMPK